MVHVSPELDAMLGKLDLLTIVGQMLEDDDCLWIYRPYMVSIICENIDTRLVIIAP